MTAKYLKKKILRKINFTNFCIACCAVLASFCVVSVSGALQDRSSSDSGANGLVSSAVRIADAFEFYNQKRFTQ